MTYSFTCAHPHRLPGQHIGDQPIELGVAATVVSQEASPDSYIEAKPWMKGSMGEALGEVRAVDLYDTLPLVMLTSGRGGTRKPIRCDVSSSIYLSL